MPTRVDSLCTRVYNTSGGRRYRFPGKESEMMMFAAASAASRSASAASGSASAAKAGWFVKAAVAVAMWFEGVFGS